MQESLGMICGEDELGLGEDTDGIMVLDTKAKVGIPASEYFQLESDTVFNISLPLSNSILILFSLFLCLVFE